MPSKNVKTSAGLLTAVCNVVPITKDQEPTRALVIGNTAYDKYMARHLLNEGSKVTVVTHGGKTDQFLNHTNATVYYCDRTKDKEHFRQILDYEKGGKNQFIDFSVRAVEAVPILGNNL
eukprot:CAMPEP_0179245258 /NCGR_PEP_ID=MMETSP0797-20121207/18479_1 /TAXON_ID=47934 /ORGANISM="Dinophysis acuminata, Strain DAEP01" /LENGTH=118 /DNA_ID=CAMNT_0020952797 /DNA_START=71 /DNA_END=427 /DNA_ORIENTATION=+